MLPASVNQEISLVDVVEARQDWVALLVVGVNEIVLIPTILLELNVMNCSETNSTHKY